jgi:HD superfamily phosphohydrolase
VIVYDPLYGRFETPRFLDQLIVAPEVRRLADVRLINAPSPSLPALSDVRRFSHTLGVLFLTLQNPHIGLTKEEVRALLATVLIHDAATPPFAHLLEYYLGEVHGWSHEAAIGGLLTGHHTVENSAHQILPGEQIKYQALCRRAKVDFDLVLEIASKKHRVSPLLFGTLDFDNLDNILRMSWALGQPTNVTTFVNLARELSVDINGQVTLQANLRTSVDEWATTRRRIYDILVFDEATVASQAVLARAIRTQFQQRPLDDIIVLLRDQDLVDVLSNDPSTKDLMLRHFKAGLPQQVYALQVPGRLHELGFSSRDEAINRIESVAGNLLSDPFGYVFVDRGAFSKRLSFRDPASGEFWVHGDTSESVVFYCFARYTERISPALAHDINAALTAALPNNNNVGDRARSASN